MKFESKEDFYNKISDYYLRKNGVERYLKKVEELSSALAAHFYMEYMDFRKMYPKSIIRYSKLKIQDLENPFTHDFIIKFCKENYPDEYVSFCSCLFELSLEEFEVYEKRRSDFEEMF